MDGFFSDSETMTYMILNENGIFFKIKNSDLMMVDMCTSMFLERRNTISSQPYQDSLPINDLFILSSDEVLLLWGDDTQ